MQTEDIGLAAGEVWNFLKQGATSVSQVTQSVAGGPRLALMALGWLAREGKIEFYQEGRRRLVRLVG